MQYSEFTYQIDSGYAVFGVVCYKGTVIEAAPIAKYMKGWTYLQLKCYVHRKGWTMIEAGSKSCQ